MEDHIHLLSDLHPSVALADYFRDEIKRFFLEEGIDLDEKWFWEDS